MTGIEESIKSPLISFPLHQDPHHHTLGRAITSPNESTSTTRGHDSVHASLRQPHLRLLPAPQTPSLILGA